MSIIRCKEKVAHVFWDCAPHLASGMAAAVCKLDENAVIYLYDVGIYSNIDDGWSLSENWIAKLPVGRYKGYLRRADWTRNNRISGYLLSILNNLWLPLTLKSMWMILRGPKHWVFHGKMLSPVLTVFFRLIGKRLIVIHWGGHNINWNGRLSKMFGPLSLKALTHFFVLMAPEVPFFEQYLPTGKITTLPYCTSAYKDNEIVCAYCDDDGVANKSLMLGPSAWWIDAYAEILDKIPVDSWDSIVCILAYGKRDQVSEVDSFVEKYTQRFGGKFFAWRDRVPRDEYMRRMSQTPYYICPAKTQAGLGAVNAGIKMGKTIFLRGDNYEWIISRNIKVFNLDEVDDFSYDGISRYRLTAAEAMANKHENTRFYTETINPDKWLNTINVALKRK